LIKIYKNSNSIPKSINFPLTSNLINLGLKLTDLLKALPFFSKRQPHPTPQLTDQQKLPFAHFQLKLAELVQLYQIVPVLNRKSFRFEETGFVQDLGNVARGQARRRFG
jgi:hypothetical protein